MAKALTAFADVNAKRVKSETPFQLDATVKAATVNNFLRGTVAKQKFQIYFGADHGGFALKEELKTFLHKKGYIFHDLGNYVEDKDDDYPEFARRVAKSVQTEKGMGILVCRSGTGVAIVANKFAGVRAVSAKSVKETEKARQDEDANVLALGADYLKPKDAKKIVKTFLLTQFSKKSRHTRRLKEIEAIENTTK